MECDILILLYLRSVEDSVVVGGAGVGVEVPSSLKKVSASSPAELKATKRVYNHPTFRQNLSKKNQCWHKRRSEGIAYSPNALLNSLLASVGHQYLETTPAQTTPTVTEMDRFIASRLTSSSCSLIL